jgi:hypothetical protein
MANTVELNERAVKAYLDSCIRHWRLKRLLGSKMACHYIDAYQSVRVSLFDELLPPKG